MYCRLASINITPREPGVHALFVLALPDVFVLPPWTGSTCNWRNSHRQIRSHRSWRESLFHVFFSQDNGQQKSRQISSDGSLPLWFIKYYLVLIVTFLITVEIQNSKP